VITYAVVGHNEEALLANALGQALEARRDGDTVWFVDSASTDGSVDIARDLGAEVVPAPIGKGRAVSTAIARCETSHICLLDADIESTSANVPGILRDALERTGADMVVGEFVWPAKPFRPLTNSVWRPVVGALFPEAAASVRRVPLSGFRVLDVELGRAPLPPGFGLEVHFNIVGSLDGRRTETVDMGIYNGPVRWAPGVSVEVAEAILDLGERYGRIVAGGRPRWEEWLRPVLELLEDRSMDEESRLSLLAEAVARPLPSAEGVGPLSG
jgi:glycosyltransferase involved in cell wall biosynthesis